MKKVKIPAIVILLLLCTYLIWHFRILNRDEVVFTHLFYIPVVISVYWWQYRGFYVIIYLSSLLLGTGLYFNDYAMLVNDAVRTLIFSVVGLTVAFLKSESMRLSGYLKYGQIISAMQNPVAISARDGVIILKNRKFSEIFPGVESSVYEFRGLIGESGFSDFSKALKSSFEKGNISFSSYLKSYGSENRFFNINFNTLSEYNNSDNLLLTFWDMTEQKRTEERLQTAVERQRLAVDVLNVLNRQEGESDALREILDLVRESTGVEHTGIILKSGGRFSLYGLSGSGGGFSEEMEAGCSFVNDRLKGERVLCLCGRLFSDYNSSVHGSTNESSVLWYNDLAAVSENEGIVLCGFIKRCGFRSAAVIPFSGEDGLAGFFLLYDSERNFFNKELVDYYHGVVQSIGIALNRNLTEARLRKTIEEKEHLIKEVHHRVKNNMQIITSLISLQTSRQSDDHIRSVLNDCQNRVRAMALVHERLYNSSDFSSINFQNYIQTLVPMLLTSYRTDRYKVKTVINVSDIAISIGTAIPLAQLINELVSNSLKHAFTGESGGEVLISLLTDDLSGVYTLTVSDDGQGFPQDTLFPQGGNLGFQLIDALIKQLRGKYTLKGDAGVSFIITFSDR